MPRKPRIQYPGACYHVLCRGNRNEDIFFDDRDRDRDRDRDTFLCTLGEACEQTGWVVHCYVLMSNHYHLLLETPEANLSQGMQWFQGTYGHAHQRVPRSETVPERSQCPDSANTQGSA